MYHADSCARSWVVVNRRPVFMSMIYGNTLFPDGITKNALQMLTIIVNAFCYIHDVSSLDQQIGGHHGHIQMVVRLVVWRE